MLLRLVFGIYDRIKASETVGRRLWSDVAHPQAGMVIEAPLAGVELIQTTRASVDQHQSIIGVCTAGPGRDQGCQIDGLPSSP